MSKYKFNIDNYRTKIPQNSPEKFGDSDFLYTFALAIEKHAMRK